MFDRIFDKIWDWFDDPFGRKKRIAYEKLQWRLFQAIYNLNDKQLDRIKTKLEEREHEIRTIGDTISITIDSIW